MAKRQKKSAPGVPEWVVTFGDMMSLLLCFFILLQMFSELKQDHEYQRVITAIKEAFGYAGGIGTLPVDDPPLKSMIQVLENMAIKNFSDAEMSENDDASIEGAHTKVTKIRDGVVFTIGGPATFEEHSAVVPDSVKEQLARIARLIAGRNNKVIIRGHATPKYLPADSPFEDLDALSYQRAKNVMEVLIGHGIDERVFRLEAVGTREPVVPRAIEPHKAAENRRVEVILTEQLVEEFNTDVHGADEKYARGG